MVIDVGVGVGVHSIELHKYQFDTILGRKKKDLTFIQTFFYLKENLYSVFNRTVSSELFFFIIFIWSDMLLEITVLVKCHTFFEKKFFLFN